MGETREFSNGLIAVYDPADPMTVCMELDCSQKAAQNDAAQYAVRAAAHPPGTPLPPLFVLRPDSPNPMCFAVVTALPTPLPSPTWRPGLCHLSIVVAGSVESEWRVTDEADYTFRCKFATTLRHQRASVNMCPHVTLDYSPCDSATSARLGHVCAIFVAVCA